MPLAGFHPAVARWFESRFGAPTEPQARAWPLIGGGRDVLVAAPAGSGKTFAAFLAALDGLVRQGLNGTLAAETQAVYVSPLKALSHDIQKNLAEPLAEIRSTLEQLCLPDVEIRTLLRTGDTPSAERQAMIKKPPHILVTTPESLYLMLTAERSRAMLRTARTVIVDEIHAVARDLDLAIEIPSSPLEAVMAAEVWEELYDRIARLIGEHRTTLVFVNTRRLAER